MVRPVLCGSSTGQSQLSAPGFALGLASNIQAHHTGGWRRTGFWCQSKGWELWILPSGAAWGWMQAPQCGGYERICTFVDFHRSIYKETSYVSKSRFLYPVSLSASLWFCCFREKPEAVFQVVINTLCTKPVCWLGVIKAFKERSLFPAKTLV